MEAPQQQEGKSQRTRRLNDELHALVRQRNLKACLAALAQGEKIKMSMEGATRRRARPAATPRRRDRGVPRCRGAITPSMRVVSRNDGSGWSPATVRDQTPHRRRRPCGYYGPPVVRGGKCAPGVEACTAAVKALGSNDVDAAFSLDGSTESGGLVPRAPRMRSFDRNSKAEPTHVKYFVAGLSERRTTRRRAKSFTNSRAGRLFQELCGFDVLRRARPSNARKVLGDDADASSLVAIAAAEALLGETKCTETARQALTVVGRHNTQGIRDDARRQASNEAYRRHRDEEAKREAAAIDVVPASRTVEALRRMLCCSRSEVLSGVERRDALTLRFRPRRGAMGIERFQEPGDGRGAKKKRRDNVRVVRDAIAGDARFSPPIDLLELVEATSTVVELGSGSGEWAAAKALSDPSTVLLAVESRCDRAASILKRSVLDDVITLCVAHGDAANVLRALKPGSVACIHANFPEPPSQTCLGTDMPHMLSVETFAECGACFKAGWEVCGCERQRGLRPVFRGGRA